MTPPGGELPAGGAVQVGAMHASNVTIHVYGQPGGDGTPEGPVPPAEAGQAGPNPYQSLEPFSEEDTALFFGREREIAALRAKFAALHDSAGERRPRLLCLLGPSGSGKSSLLRAGLVPELKRQPLRPEATRIVVLTPTNEPLFNLANGLALARIGDGDKAEQARLAQTYHDWLRGQEVGGWPGLSRIAANIAEGRDETLIVAYDQFEEIYTQAGDEEREILLGNLFGAVSEPGGRVSAIVAYRSDFLDRTAADPALNAQMTSEQGHFLVRYLDEQGLRAAIEQPAALAGRPFAPALVDLLVREAQEEAALPALQFTLAQLWEAPPEKTPEERLRELGGVGGALATRGDEILSKLDRHQQDLVRRAFLATVRLGEGERDTRKRPSIRDITGPGEDRDRILDAVRLFAAPDARLLSLFRQKEEIAGGNGANGDATRFESRTRFTVAHETLFRRWRTLQTWINEQRDTLRFYYRLSADTERWVNEGKKARFLWSGADLDELIALRRAPPIPFSAEQNQFARRSIRRRMRGRALAASALVALIALAGGLGWRDYQGWVDKRDWGEIVHLGTGEVQPLHGRLVNVGRAAAGLSGFEPDVKFTPPSVSRSHLQINRNGLALDLRSTYGTTKNAAFMNYAIRVEIADGDIFVLGGDTPVQYLERRYAWYEWLIPDAYMDEKMRAHPPMYPSPCGWGILIGQANGAPFFRYLSDDTHLIRVAEGGLEIDDSAGQDPQIRVHWVFDNVPVKIREWPRVTDFVVLAGEDPLRDYPVVAAVQINDPTLSVEVEIRPDPYNITSVLAPIGAELTHALPHYPGEERYNTLPINFLNFKTADTRFQIVPFEWPLAFPDCSN
ncbi:AAA family ATPase [Rhodobacteraceae bacterium NNCM2]|nr:AAA family ATPase [Coraliihabitans acroporae]